MKLLKIRLNNFKGVREAEFAFNGNNASIYGANGTGKTTVFDAFTWLLFGKPSEDHANFSPKTITDTGYAHNLEHNVECEIEIDGNVTVFKRSYHEVYKKIRGKSESVFSGHKTEYWIDGVPKKEKEYVQFWQSIFPNDDVIKMLTVPFFFADQLNWEKRRNILMDICGDVSDMDVINSAPELKELTDIIGTRSVSDHKKVVKASRTEINKQLELIPARIDEAKKAIPERILKGTKEEIQAKKSDISKKISELERQKSAALSGDNSAVVKAIDDLKTRLAESRYNYNQQKTSVAESANDNIFGVQTELQYATELLLTKRKLLDQSEFEFENIKKKRFEIIGSHKRLQREFTELKSQQFDDSLTVCDKCGQTLPAERIALIKEEYNERKSNKLNELVGAMNSLVEQGKVEASKSMLAEKEKEVENCAKLVKDVENKIGTLKEQLRTAKEEAKKSELPPFEETAEYAEMSDKMEELQRGFESSKPDTSSIDAQIADLSAKESMLHTELSAIEMTEIQEKRINELERTERNLGKEYEKAEKELYLCDKFIRTKAEMLTEKINSKFKTVRFQLFKNNVTNDGTDDICDVLVPAANSALVPFADANKAAKVNAGIELIQALGEHYGIEMPIFVDNAESISHIIPTNQQLIRLIVSEADTVLRLEI